MNKRLEDIEEQAASCRKDIADKTGDLIGILGLLGLDVHVAPDGNSFVIIANDQKKMVRDSLMGETLSNSFCFRLEFDMLAKGRMGNGSDIACGIFMKNTLVAVLDAVNSAIKAYMEKKEGASESTIV